MNLFLIIADDRTQPGFPSLYQVAATDAATAFARAEELLELDDYEKPVAAIDLPGLERLVVRLREKRLNLIDGDEKTAAELAAG